MTDSPEATVRRYYDALRDGEPLHPFFVDEGFVVKVGIGERMVGADAVAEGLREQTRTTSGWEVESHDLQVGSAGPAGTAEEPAFAWFGDEVFMAWNDTVRGIRFEFETRWSGALVRSAGEEEAAWRFVEMHVSTPGET